MNSSCFSRSRCAACEASSPRAAKPAPMIATAIRSATRVKPDCLQALIASGAASHVVHPAFLRVGGRHGDPGGGALCERIARDRAQVALGDELLERLRINAGICVMLVEGIAQQVQVFLE